MRKSEVRVATRYRLVARDDHCPLNFSGSASDVAHGGFCEGLRMPAHDGGAARTGAGVREPSQKRSVENDRLGEVGTHLSR
jgi:hypothetical protein